MDQVSLIAHHSHVAGICCAVDVVVNGVSVQSHALEYSD
jgi:hypothetical protein